MIKKQHMSLDEAFKTMRQARQIVDPNVSFILQLQQWEKECWKPKELVEETRATSSIYCGSTSKNKNEGKPRPDSSIIVK